MIKSVLQKGKDSEIRKCLHIKLKQMASAAEFVNNYKRKVKCQISNFYLHHMEHIKATHCQNFIRFLCHTRKVRSTLIKEIWSVSNNCFH